MDRFEEMQAFVKVVESGSFSAAAERMDIAKSAISRRLSELEARLGVQLLHRTTRRINLTETGRQFYQRCLRILADLDETEQMITSEHGTLSGMIRIAAPLSFGIEHLSPVLNEFLKLHPELNLDLDLNDRTLKLMDEGVDLAIRIGQLQDSSMVARKLAVARRILCASPEYLQNNGVPEHPRDLQHHSGLVYSNLPEATQWLLTDQKGEAFSVRVPCRMRANNGDVLLNAAIDGLGIVATVTFIGYKAIEQGLLTQILPEYQFADTGIYAIYPSQRHLPKRVRVLIDYLATCFAEPPYWDKNTPID